MVTKKVIESTLKDAKAYAEYCGKNIEFLSLRRENGMYCLVSVVDSGGYFQYSHFMSGKEMMIYLAGLSKGLSINSN